MALQVLHIAINNLTIVSFLLPLLKHNAIALRGHIAYDIGNLYTVVLSQFRVGDIGMFQDIPLSIQVLTSRQHLNLSADNELGTACSQLLLWLVEVPIPLNYI